MAERGWQHFPHKSDLGICGWGPTMDAAFEEAALARTAAVTRADVASATRVDIRCEAADPELLLVAWLNAVIYEMAVRRMLFGRFEVRISGVDLGRDDQPRAARTRLRTQGCHLQRIERVAGRGRPMVGALRCRRLREPSDGYVTFHEDRLHNMVHRARRRDARPRNHLRRRTIAARYGRQGVHPDGKRRVAARNRPCGVCDARCALGLRFSNRRGLPHSIRAGAE